ncbi:MAG: DUF4384 domain-containing protein [Bacteroidetes bacterium]|nr:DUF4384 domain-containing protein [Fibrella sp.]
MQRLLFYTLLPGLLAGPALAQKTYPRGLTLDDAAYESVPLKAVLTKGNFDKLAPRVSYEAFCPPVMSQDDYNTCVAFATTYYMRTMLETIRQKQPGSAVNRAAFSPSYTYEKIKTAQDVNCKGGSRLPDALFALKTYGAPRYDALPYPSCADPGNTLDALAAPHKIGDVIRLFGTGATPGQKVLFMKKALSEGYPVVIGMHTPLSFFATRDVWEPAPGDALVKNGEGHALCVIGYDDARFGGAFRVVNSWGTGWADGGFCWIRYNDLARFTPYAFQAFPSLTPVAPTEAPALAAGMNGTVEFRLRDGLLMNANPTLQKGVTGVSSAPGPLTAQSMVYRMAETYPSGTAFKVFVNNSKQAYLYMIGTDTTYQMTRLFPYADGISPLLGPNTTVAYPSETKSVALDNTKGTDYVLMLFSKKPLDYTRLMDQMQRTPGNLADRVMTVLKDDLIKGQSIRYRTDAVGFDLDETAIGSVVPVLVALDHQ